VRPAAVLAVSLVLVPAAAGGDAPNPGFRYGVAAGEVTSTSAILWTRAPRAGQVRLFVAERPAVDLGVRYVARARPADDLTVAVRVPVQAGRRYWFQFVQPGASSSIGTFRAAPASHRSANVRFAISGDADATPDRDGKPAYSFRVYARMAAERNDFNINMGDTIYSDSSVGGAPAARTVAEKWGKYKLVLAQPELRRLRAAAGLYSHWDDHEFVNDFSRPEHGNELYRAGVKAFRDYSPVRYGANGLFRTVRWGRNLELFFLDQRSFRSGKVTAACNSDFAPTAPQTVREAFGTLAPSLRNPVPPACLAAINDPSRTMLGARQYAAFTKAIAASTATWKVIVNEVPIQQFYAQPYDRWEGYAAERQRLLRFLRGVKNVVFLTTDMHASAVNEVRLRTLGGPPEGTGIWEVVTGPVATNTYSTSVDRLLGISGGGTAVASLFFKPKPPNGVGMRCAALDVPSYAQVTLTAKRLTVASRDARGRLVQEKTGRVCAPLVLRAR
jgi:phosphodiesterase/alkaline phosphatase D-like protein